MSYQLQDNCRFHAIIWHKLGYFAARCVVCRVSAPCSFFTPIDNCFGKVIETMSCWVLLAYMMTHRDFGHYQVYHYDSMWPIPVWNNISGRLLYRSTYNISLKIRYIQPVLCQDTFCFHDALLVCYLHPASYLPLSITAFAK